MFMEFNFSVKVCRELYWAIQKNRTTYHHIVAYTMLYGMAGFAGISLHIPLYPTDSGRSILSQARDTMSP
jgi:hypothetical protein